MRFDLSLYLVLDPVLCGGADGMVDTARAAVAGGATLVQLRHKTASTAERIAIGRALKSALPNTPLIVNDDAQAARAIGADGLHIGQEDISPAKARALIGPDMALGLSVHTRDLAAQIDPRLVDHVGVGPVFGTATKGDHKAPIGFDGLADVIAALPVPAVAIGGLKLPHVAQTFAAGAQGMAVVSAICGTASPQDAARALATSIKEVSP